MARRQGGRNSKRYPRVARLNETMREIVAEEIERIDDERLGFFTVTAAEVDPGLEHAKIHWSDLGATDEEVLAVLDEHRVRIQRAVNQQTHWRRTPIISFHADQVHRGALRVEEILRGLEETKPAATTEIDPEDVWDDDEVSDSEE